MQEANQKKKRERLYFIFINNQVKQNMHKYKVQLLDLHEGQVYYE